MPTESTMTILPEGSRVSLLSTRIAPTYSAQFWRLRGNSALVNSLLMSGLAWVWESSMTNTSRLQDRPYTVLNRESALNLQEDLAEECNDRGRRYTLIGCLESQEVTPETLKAFLMTGSGLEVVIYQPDDSDEYIFVSATPSSATNQLLDSWQLQKLASHVSEPLWLRITRKTGKLPA